MASIEVRCQQRHGVTSMLSEVQTRVVNHHEGAMLVLAGAGSGKTTVVVHRAASMIEGGLSPDRLLMLTFSKKAATEMRQRLSAEIDYQQAEAVDIHTFHGFGYRTLLDSPEQCSRTGFPCILDETDSRMMYRRIASDVYGFDTKETPVDDWFNLWSLIKQDGCNVYDRGLTDRIAAYLNRRFGYDYPAKKITEIFARYESFKQSDNVVDYDDLVLLPTIAMLKTPDFSDEIGSKFDAITVDEAQDTNLIQYKMVHALGLKHSNVCLVGDDDQSIYSWRGAEIGNIQRFIRDFKPETVPLEQNFRSTRYIVEAAGRLIVNNTSRLDKSPFSADDSGDRPSAFLHDTSRDMADVIVSQLSRSIESGQHPSDIAVLYRTNRMVRILESRLLAAGIPFNVVGGMSLFDRKEIKSIVAGIRLSLNQQDSTAANLFCRLLPGVGVVTASKVINAMRDNGDSFISAVQSQTDEVRKKIEGPFYLMLIMLDQGPQDYIKWVCGQEGLGIIDGIKDEQERLSRRNNVEQFYAEIERLMDERADKDWATLIGELHLSQESVSNDGEGVTLSTIHRAKGLEWDTVHIAGFSDRLLPLHNNRNEIENLEEERRLGYVGLTRSKSELVVHHADCYFFPGSEPLLSEPSRFLYEMGDVVLETDYREQLEADIASVQSGPLLSRLRMGI